ncbi:penicillin-binding protein 2 [Caldisericum exile]|uniref:Penicillin-binding protein n=1 Tax=Caldisericum exile (strain DSM 21853 / NBRC 104410 / AZM16c01) TaxID=511051 RepID=A0A7U6GEU2_CALEA|nr:penicillin-binding protein 2 [Caldisericum exile]BAL81073.1 putative penicillin-binding protein [Caldisericum exile AZM16c01]
MNRRKLEFNYIIYSLILVLIFTLMGRAYYLQIVKGDYYNELSQYRSVRIIETQPMRGRILDKNGVVLAEDIPSYSVAVVMEDVKNPQEEFKILSSIIGIEQSDIEEKIRKANVPPYENVIIKKDISIKERVQIEELQDRLPGINVITSYKRYYPFKEIGSAFLGYVGPVTLDDIKTDSYYDINDVIGKQGLELQYEKYLRGIKGKKEVLVDAIGRVKSVLYEEKPIPGNDIYLNIDINVQKNLEDLVGDRTGVSIVMDPRTGGIIAMVSHPTFDPNLFVNGISEKDYKTLLEKNAFINRAVQSRFPPGSTFKSLTLISALEKGVITKETIIDCGPYVTIGGRNFKDWVYPSSFGRQTPSVALANSSDVFFYKLGLMTGEDTIKHYADLLKVADLTQIDLPFEISGIVPSPQWKKEIMGEQWYLGDTANMSIGQGFVSLTPIEVASFYQIIANNGVGLTPHLLDKIVSPKGEIIFEYKPQVRVEYKFKQDTLNTVKDGLEGLSNKPDMRIMRVNGVIVCSKTGTAEVGDKEAHVHHWLVSFSPRENASVLGLFFFEYSTFPSSHALAPLMRDLLKNFF